MSRWFPVDHLVKDQPTGLPIYCVLDLITLYGMFIFLLPQLIQPCAPLLMDVDTTDMANFSIANKLKFMLRINVGWRKEKKLHEINSRLTLGQKNKGK